MSRVRRQQKQPTAQATSAGSDTGNDTRTTRGKSFILPVALGLVAFFGTFMFFRWNKSVAQSPADTKAKVTKPNSDPAPKGMVWIPPGEFRMGSEDQVSPRNERPAHSVKLDGFWMDAHEVTNAEFQEFVDATGYKTTAEKAPDWEEMKKELPPGTPKPPDDVLVPGSLVFNQPKQRVGTEDVSQWWSWTKGAEWLHPEGPDSTIKGRENHPVVHVSWFDANEYAKWAGKRLPTEAEWEYAARGKLAGKRFTWGDEPPTEASSIANIWQGEFPNRNDKRDGWERTSPVETYPANGYGLYDMAGNAWEWCSDWYRADAYIGIKGTLTNPPGPEDSWDPNEPHAAKRVIRGGSFLCHVTYCESYRTAARRGNSPDTGMSHLSFRCVKSAAAVDSNK